MKLFVGEMKSATGRFFTGFIRDLTERAESEARLQEIQNELARLARVNELGEMASTLAHELNQPLAAIANYAQGCVRFLNDVDDTTAVRIREALEEMAKQSLRAGGIIRHLREFVTRGETEKSPEDVRKLIEEAGVLALVGSREQGVRPVFEFFSEQEDVMVDKVQIQQVLINLMRNRMEAMRESDRRELVVRTGRSGPGHIMIEVADTGPGISDEIAARLFQPFVTTKANGMGIGLSISKRIVEAHGGQISVTRNTKGGATFRFSLPSQKMRPPMHIDSYVVHVVDDEEPVRKSLAFLLTMVGFTVRVHEFAASFLASMQPIGKACLVTDLKMPGMSGVELLEKLNETGAMIPAIVITGHGDVPMAVAAMKAGAIDFIEKPFEDEVLVEAIKSAASQLEEIARPVEDAAVLSSRLDHLSERERQVCPASLLACLTRRSPTISASAPARSRSIAPISCRRCRPGICPSWCA